MGSRVRRERLFFGIYAQMVAELSCLPSLVHSSQVPVGSWQLLNRGCSFAQTCGENDKKNPDKASTLGKQWASNGKNEASPNLKLLVQRADSQALHSLLALTWANRTTTAPSSDRCADRRVQLNRVAKHFSDLVDFLIQQLEKTYIKQLPHLRTRRPSRSRLPVR